MFYFLYFTAFASVEDILKVSQSVDAISGALPGRPPTLIMLMEQIWKQFLDIS